MINVKEIGEKEVWEKFNLQSKNPSFLGSWGWGEFQKSLGKPVFRLGIFEKDELLGISQIYREKTKLGSFFYCPAGPVLRKTGKDIIKLWTECVSSIAKNHGVAFLRIDPRVIGETEKNLFQEYGFTPAPEYTQPECTATITLTLSLDQIKSSLSSSTRYNINAASRKGVEIKEGGVEDIDTFLNLLKETAGRKNLSLPSEQKYHKKQFEILVKEGLMKLYTANFEDTPLSAALVVNYAGTSYYLHAANSLKKKELRASYPLVWHSINEAKKKGLRVFDFWGVTPSNDPKHPWFGVTSFKLSFGASRTCYEKPLDLPLSSNYQLMKTVEIWRKPVKKLFRFGR